MTSTRTTTRSSVRRPRLRRRVVLSALLLAGAAVIAWRAQGPDRIRVITEGRVYQSGLLGHGALEEVVRRLGIRTVVDLRKADDIEQDVRGPDDAERATLAALGADYVHLPTTQVPKDRTVVRFLELMERPEVYPVLIHCHHGLGRSVLFSALYRIEFEGWDNERARRATRLFLPWSSFDADAPKGEYLIGYTPRLRHTADQMESQPSTVVH